MEPGQAYRLWAPTYAAETVVSFLDEELASALSPPLEGSRLLDAGCGTGRRLARRDTTLAIGVDTSLEMLVAGGAVCVAVADVRALPFPSQSFDVVWCRLVLGHIGDPLPAYRELARVCRIGGSLFVSDFHADAVAAGHRRSFRDREGSVHEIEHHVHDNSAHAGMAARAGLEMRAQRHGCVGPGVKEFYVCAGRDAAYEQERGLALVAAFLFQRTA
ncbi:MAG TPA: class I SAM-dependent methyltransferase [Rhizomicrobium sp.]|jgi:malonyl-CoA O-methyltransferase